MILPRGKYHKKKYKPIKKRKQVGTSKAEAFFGLFLKRLGLEIETQFQISWKFYDFKIKGKKILIEFHGSYWHGSEELYTPDKLNEMQKKNIINDAYKKKLAEKYGYEIIYVWEHEFNKDPNKVKNELLKALKEV